MKIRDELIEIAQRHNVSDIETFLNDIQCIAACVLLDTNYAEEIMNMEVHIRKPIEVNNGKS